MRVLLEAHPTRLEIDTQQTTLAIIDMQNSSANKGGMFDLSGFDISRCLEIVDPLRKLAEASRAAGRRVVYIVHQYSADFREIGEPASVLWSRTRTVRSYSERPEWRDKLNIRGTWGARIVDGLAPQADDIIVEKTRYSGFWGTNLDAILKTLNTRYLAVGGTVTNLCVEGTIRDAFQGGYFPILITDASATSSPALQEATIANITRSLGWVTTSADFIRAIRQ